MIFQAGVHPTTKSPQFWEASFAGKTPCINCDKLLSTYGTQAHHHVWQQLEKDIVNLTQSDIQFQALSIIDPDQPVTSRQQYRGFTNDTEPFVFNGKAYGECYARLYPHQDGITFSTQSYEEHFTESARKQMEKHFAQPLLDHINAHPELLHKLKAECHTYNQEKLEKHIANMEKQLAELKGYL